MTPEDSQKFTRTVHMAMNIRGCLRNRSFNGFTKLDGSPMSQSEAQEGLMQLLADGYELMPIGECPDFDKVKGCPGHPIAHLG